MGGVPHLDPAAPFASLLERWWVVTKQETERWIAILTAAAKVVAADDALDSFVDTSVNAILTETRNDRGAPLYKLFMGQKAPSELKRPVLGEEPETLRGWVSLLKSSKVDALVALAPELEAAVAVADQAVAELAQAKLSNRELRATGDRLAFINDVNAARQDAYGTIAKMPHNLPDKKLPASFAQQFFKVLRAKKGPVEKPKTAPEMASRIGELERELDELKAEHAELLVEEEELAKEVAEREADTAALAQAEREATEALARAAALKAKLGM